MEAREVESAISRTLEGFAARYFAPASVPSGPTFGEFFEQYMRDHVEVHGLKSAHKIEQYWRLYLSQWADRPMTSVRRIEIIELQAKLTRERSPGVATRVIELTQMLYNKALEWELLAKNPAFRIRKFKHKSRERFLQANEMERFVEAVDLLKNATTRDYFFMLLLTAQRRKNVADMQWSEVDFDRGVWSIPMTKNGTSHICPLLQEAMAILHRRKTDPKCHPVYVFPLDDGSGPIYNRQNSWKLVLKLADLPGLRMHDLRRTLASWQAITGSSLPIIGQTLNHKEASSTQIYARLNVTPVRESMETAVAKMNLRPADMEDDLKALAAAQGDKGEPQDTEGDGSKGGGLDCRQRDKNAKKVLACIKAGRDSRNALVRMLGGGGTQIRKDEMTEILAELEAAGQIHSFKEKTWQRGYAATRYALGPKTTTDEQDEQADTRQLDRYQRRKIGRKIISYIKVGKDNRSAFYKAAVNVGAQLRSSELSEVLAELEESGQIHCFTDKPSREGRVKTRYTLGPRPEASLPAPSDKNGSNGHNTRLIETVQGDREEPSASEDDGKTDGLLDYWKRNRIKKKIITCLASGRNSRGILYEAAGKGKQVSNVELSEILAEMEESGLLYSYIEKKPQGGRPTTHYAMGPKPNNT